MGSKKRFCLHVGDTACRMDYGIIMYCTRLSVFRQRRLLFCMLSINKYTVRSDIMSIVLFPAIILLHMHPISST